eukprot:scaffold316235_cov32-Tisochrysis_lutea.AAC.1
MALPRPRPTSTRADDEAYTGHFADDNDGVLRDAGGPALPEDGGADEGAPRQIQEKTGPGTDQGRVLKCLTRLLKFVRNIRVPDTTQELLKFGGKLVVDGATTTGVRLRSKKRPEAGKQYDKLERLVVVACGSRRVLWSIMHACLHACEGPGPLAAKHS